MVFGYAKNDSTPEISDFGWSTDLETGIAEIDGQHARYFDFVNDVLATVTDAGSNSDLVDRLDFLLRYAMEHFSTEQNIMKKEDYPGFQEHFEEHMSFLKHVGSLRNQINDVGHNEKLMREVRFFTVDWFVKHIQSSDMQVVEFLKKNASQSVNF